MSFENFALDADILRYYNRGREADRLERGLSFIEYLRTVEILERFLPPAPATVLDIGGGPGRYAELLAARGYTVHLLDPVPLHIEQANERLEPHPAASAQLGDARALPYRDESADIALLLGPLYHLHDKQDRQRCFSEAYRVLKKEGLLFATALSRFAPALDALRELETGAETLEIAYLNETLVKTGEHANPNGLEGKFTTSYFYTPEDFEEDVWLSGFSLLSLVGLEGISEALRDVEAVTQNKTKLDKLLKLLQTLEGEPSILGVSSHLLAVAQK